MALDLDDCITAWPEWFAWLSRALRRDQHEVIVLTLRRDPDCARKDLERLGVQYDRLETLPEERRTDLFGWKAERCRALSVSVLVDDMPEIANRVDPQTLVLVPRDTELGDLTYVDPGPG